MGKRSNRFLCRAKARFAVIVLVLADVLALISALAVSILLRFDHLPWQVVYRDFRQVHLASLPIILALYLVIFRIFHLYRYAWRFASLEMLWAIIWANSIGTAGMVIIQTLMDGQRLPRSVTVMFWVASITLIGSLRIMLRILSITQQPGGYSLRSMRRDVPPKRVIILGAGAAGVRVLRAIREDSALNYTVVGFLDDDPRAWGVYICNSKVLGPFSLLKQLAIDDAMDEVIVALPSTSDRSIHEHIIEVRRRKIPVKVVPHLRDVLTGEQSIRFTDFSVEDLLRRPVADTDVSEKGAYLTGKKVLITGAGGSIGSELCRQIAVLCPDSLFLLGHGENSIHQIHQELRNTHPQLSERIQYVIASVSHRHRINQTFERYRPDVVFHAAAHKHVPIMETNEQEAVTNNVLGTDYVAEACGRYGVERMVFISTDKAADPCCVMGATKWLCEEVVRAMGDLWHDTSFVAVRFGNVLGSRGSVVPMFKGQISRGGPVTITHPEMTRYFMTIPEAVRLVLQAGAVGETGKLYLLDMGEPMKIVDLATDMIRLCGCEPGVDVQIQFTGIRPGEKLHERLVSGQEHILKTPWEGLFLVRRPDYYTPDELTDAIRRLESAANYGTSADIRRLLNQMVPCPERSENAAVVLDEIAEEIDLRNAEP